MTEANSPVVTARGLSVSLGAREVLRAIDLSISAGRITVLIGPNGGGKTTLLRALLGQIKSKGEVTWQGRPLSRWGRGELARVAAYLPQAPTFEPGDRVIDVLRLGRLPYGGMLGLDSTADDEVIETVAADLSLQDLLNRRVETLSGGQRQRVFLGRALAQQPKAILLDEPATYLDLRHQVELYTLLGRMAREKNIAVLMASHDVNLSLVHADEAIILKEGQLIDSGEIESVLTEATLTEAFSMPIRKISDGSETVFVPNSAQA